MKKQRDLMPDVMDRVTSLEKERIGNFRRVFRIGIGLLLFGVVVSTCIVVRILMERGTFELFSIFAEDFQIIREYIGDVVLVVVADLPYETVATGLLFGMILVVILVWTAKRRRIDRIKGDEIEKYAKNRDTMKARKKENV